MNQTMMVILAGLVQLLTAFFAYQYLTHRVDGKCQARNLFRFKTDFWCLIAVLSAFFAGTYIFMRGFLWNNDSFMRAMMNAEVMIWLCVLGYIDARERIIPNGMIGLGVLFWLVLTLMDIFLGGTPWLQLLVFSGVGGIACGGILLVIALIVKSALGMGDVKLLFVLGLLYGLTDTFGILLFSVIAMGIVSIVLLIAKKLTTKSTIPMAPFVVVGFILSIIAGM